MSLALWIFGTIYVVASSYAFGWMLAEKSRPAAESENTALGFVLSVCIAIASCLLWMVLAIFHWWPW